MSETKKNNDCFSADQLGIVNKSVDLAEELVSNYYKMSANQWLRLNYDIVTLTGLTHCEIVNGPFAQVIRYEAKSKDSALGSSAYDFYKICLQDHSILSSLRDAPELKLLPFVLYIVTHELIHIVRFCKFLQNFNASEKEKNAEEVRVHKRTRDILAKVRKTSGIRPVMRFFRLWHERAEPVDRLC